MSWLTQITPQTFTAASSIATVAAATFAAFEFRRQSKLSKIQLEDRFDRRRREARKLSLLVTENRDLGPNVNTPSIQITISNRSRQTFKNIVLNIPDFPLESTLIHKGRLPEDNDLRLYNIAPEHFDDPREWKPFVDANQLKVGRLNTTWILKRIAPGDIYRFAISFREAFEWNLWEGVPGEPLDETDGPLYVTSIIFEDSKNTWYTKYDFQGTTARLQPEWNPDRKSRKRRN